MMSTASLPAAAHPEHLTAALRNAGALGDGRVSDVTVMSSRDMLVSHIMRLGLSYDGDAAGAPQSLILKTALAAFAGTLRHAGRHEIAFYTEVAPLMPGNLTPRCFEGHCDPDSGNWHLLLEDLTETHHVATVWPLPPTAKQCESIVRALARVHAAWWDDPRLGQSIGIWLELESTRATMRQLTEHYERFAGQMGDRLPAQRRALYERYIEAAPRLLQRYHSRRDVTIAHGDAHVWNFMLPQAPDRDDVRLFDFDQWRINVGAYDLAYMMAPQWYPDRRRQLEQQLLDCYHDTLLGHGVQGYSRRALDDDYRRGVLWHISKPVWQHAIGLPPMVWWNNLERILLAVDDLGCRDLLD